MLSQSNPPRDGREQDRACKQTYSFLRSQFKGGLLRPGDPGYEDARAIWNGMVAQKPGLIASCVDCAMSKLQSESQPIPVFLALSAVEDTVWQASARATVA